MRSAWNRLSSENIMNSWRHSGLLDKRGEMEPLIDLTTGSTAVTEIREIGGDLERLNPLATRIRVASARRR